RVVLGHIPLADLSFQRDRKHAAIGSAVAGSIQALAPIMQNAQRRLIFPVDQLPSDQRMLVFRIANEGGVLPAVVMLPPGKLVAALSVFHGANERSCRFLRRMVA